MNVIPLAQMLEFSQKGDERGHLVIAEGGKDIPFEIKRDRPTRETAAAMRAALRISRDPDIQGYEDPKELLRDLND